MLYIQAGFVASAKERYERELAEHQAKLAARAAKEKATGKKPGGKPPAPPVEGPLPSDQVNVTDEESRIMPVSGGSFEQCYNAQAAVAEGQFIGGHASAFRAEGKGSGLACVSYAVNGPCILPLSCVPLCAPRRQNLTVFSPLRPRVRVPVTPSFHRLAGEPGAAEALDADRRVPRAGFWPVARSSIHHPRVPISASLPSMALRRSPWDSASFGACQEIQGR